MLNAAEAKHPLREPVLQAQTVSVDRTAVLSALFVTGFATFLNLYITQPLLPLFRHLFNASELLVSLTVSAPVLAVAAAAPLVGLFADTLGRKRIIVAAMLGLSLTTGLTATAINLRQLIAWRFMQGLFIPGIIAVTMAYISEESPCESVGSTMATYVTGTVVGGFAGRFMCGLFATHYGWPTAFVCLGALSLAGTAVTCRLLPRSTRFVPQNNISASLQSLGMHLHNPQLLATYAIGFNALFCLVGAFTYVNFYLADRPFCLGPAALGTIFVVYLIGAVITPVGGAILDRIGYRRTLTGAVGMVATGTITTLVPSIPVIVAGLTLIATGMFICQSVASSYVGKAAGKARSSAAGGYVALYYFGGCIGSILPGVFWEKTGWIGCVAIILFMQASTAIIAHAVWKD